MRRASFWLLPALVVAALLLTLVGDLVGLLLSTPAREEAIAFADRTDFLAAEPVFALTADATPGPAAGWQGLGLGPGWAEPEPNGAWAVGERAELSFFALAADARWLHFECLPMDFLPSSQVVSAELNGRALGAVEVARGWGWQRLAIPPRTLVAGAANRLVLRFRHQLSPRAAGVGSDPRPLAVCFRTIALVAGDGRPEAAAPHPAHGGTALVLPRPGQALLPLSSPDPAAAVNVGFELLRGTDDADARLHFVLAALSGGEVAELDGKTVTRASGDSGRVRLSARGRRGPLLLAVRLEAPRTTSGATLRDLLVEVEPVPPEMTPPRWLRWPWVGRGELPDVVPEVRSGVGAETDGASDRGPTSTPAVDRNAASSLVPTAERTAARPQLLRSPSPPLPSSVVVGSLKLVVETPDGRNRALYDLRTDPGEEHDLAPARPLVVALLAQLVDGDADAAPGAADVDP